MADAGDILGYLVKGLKIGALLAVALIVTLAFNFAVLAAAYVYFATTRSAGEAAGLLGDSIHSIWMMLGLTVTQEIAWVLVPIGFLVLVDRRLHAWLKPLLPPGLREKILSPDLPPAFSWQDLGLAFGPRAAKMFAAGMLLNALIGAGIIGTIATLGMQHVEVNGLAEYGLLAVAGSLALTVVLMLAVGVGEETLFRGYIQTDLMRKYGCFAAVVVTSLLFAGVHIFFLIAGQEVSPLSIAGIFFASLVMGYLYVITGTIWASIGFHFLQDVLAAGVFLTDELPYASYPVFHFSKAGEVVLAGVKLGSQDNLVNIAFLVLALAVLFVYHNRVRSRTTLRLRHDE
ncbi:MAG TPA: CPBP family intramembrane glutamic endopeptidase [Methanocella sp.]|nr:CPBP family intramembrane glutamic endopeptidase [Methanocella sp.]